MISLPIPYLRRVLFWCILALSVSCSALFEPSIAQNTVILDGPADGFQTSNYNTVFWWEPVDGALTYHLQVVTPSFASPSALILDTVVRADRFSFTFSPGPYQWRLKAENGSSETPYSGPKSFTINFSSIKQQSVQLLSPVNNLNTNQAQINFQWSQLYGATKYQVQIDTGNFSNESAILYDHVIPGNQLTYTFPTDHVYQWRVRAENDTAQAQWSPVFQVNFNRTPPGEVTLLAPANAARVASPVSLQWTAVARASTYKVYVYKSDGVTLLNGNFPLLTAAVTYSFNQGSSGSSYYWTVTAIDATGNESASPPVEAFTIQ